MSRLKYTALVGSRFTLTATMAYEAAHDEWPDATTWPAAAILGTTARDWAPTPAGWDPLGWEPDGQVRGAHQAFHSGGPNPFVCMGVIDVDDDDNLYDYEELLDVNDPAAGWTRGTYCTFSPPCF